MTATEPRAPRDQGSWAQPVERLTTTAKTTGQDTVTGKPRLGPRPGLRPDVAEDVHRSACPATSIRPRRSSPTGRPRFPTFWPKGSTFYAPLAGITPGEVALLEVPPVPGSPVKMSTGVLVIYADRESFTFMTPEGHALSAWITFSVLPRRRRDGRPGPGAGADERPVHRAVVHVRREPGQRPVLGADAREPRPVAGRRDAGGREPEGVRRPAPPVEVRGQRRVTARPCTWPSARSRRRPAGCAGGASGREPDPGRQVPGSGTITR